MENLSGTEKISVIVPIYQAEAYLPTCIRSIQAQTCRNLEILLMDDASQDRSYAMAMAFAETDERIRVFHLPKNQGVYAVRNQALKEATGAWIAFVDSDDRLPETALENLITAAQSAQTNMALGGYTLFYESAAGKKRDIRLKPQMLHSGFELQQYFLTEAKDNNYLWARLYRREVFQNFHFPEGRAYKDLWVLPQLLYAAQSCVVIDQPVYEYHLRSDSITGEKHMVTSMDIVEARLENERFIREQYPSLKPYVADVVIEVCCFYLGRLSRAGRAQHREEWNKTVACIHDHLPGAALHTWMLKGMRPLFSVSPVLLGRCCDLIYHLKRKGVLA